MPLRKVLFALLLSVPLCFMLRSLSSAQAIRVNVGYSAISADQLPAWVAKETGIFAKNGLDVPLIFFTGGTTAILALVSGDVPITQVSGPGLVNSALAGSAERLPSAASVPPPIPSRALRCEKSG